MLSESFFNLIVNNFLEHIFVLNHKREIVFQSENNSSLVGYSNKEITEEGFQWLFVHPKFSFDEALDKAKKYGEYFSTEDFKHKTKNSSISLTEFVTRKMNQIRFLFLFFTSEIIHNKI